MPTLMTEDEARTKFCPNGPTGDGTRCVASGCMAWRSPQTYLSVHFQKGSTFGQSGTVNNMDGLGYCGLAGKPVLSL